MTNQFQQGYQAFSQQQLSKRYQYYRQLACQHQPEHLLITCVDARIDPIELFQLQLGACLVYRNVGNVVCPYGKDPSLSALLSFAVLKLKVQHIHILGHSGCGAIQAIGQSCPKELKDWIDPLCELEPSTAETDQQDALALANIERSLENLSSYSWVKRANEDLKLTFNGWHFTIGTCAMRYKSIDDQWVLI